MRRKKISIVSKGTICDTKVKVNGKKINPHIVRYKWTEVEQALTILYFQKNRHGHLQYDDDGKIIERQFLFRDTNARFNFNICNRDNQVRLVVKNNVAKVFCDNVHLKSVETILWQVEVLSDLHEFEFHVL